ncbi:hypothetical protein TrLO_g10503 [Triparma laevis f. longispina]|uniref:Uncharacterized protein n=1 Tax=Triparma laevis f. longispina TaxID=1714387 RepID=A0A9W7KXR7_9STRA|nr:hypothetical protein TrLO_g10503 [Triparma laevis f. longispina]
MSQSAATVSKERHEIGETSRKRGGKDEEKQNGEGILTENLTTLMTAFPAPAAANKFMYTPEFRTHFVGYVPGDTLMALKLATKGWSQELEKHLKSVVKNGSLRGELLVLGGNDISENDAKARYENETKLVTRVIFLLNIMKVGDCACGWASNLVVDIPEGVENIGYSAFYHCRSSATVSFPSTLTSICDFAYN